MAYAHNCELLKLTQMSSDVSFTLHPASRAKYRGGQGTLKSSAWEVLKHSPKGLDAKELVGQIDKFGEYSVDDLSGVS